MEFKEILGEPIATVLRWRPMSHSEFYNQSEKWVSLDTNKNIVYCSQIENATTPSKPIAFNFDKVIDCTERTEVLYQDTIKPIVEAALQGVNGTVFAYGQTGSGKVFTMRGYRDPYIPGIISLSVDTIFDYIYSQCEADFTIKVVNYELYLEKIKDLSDPKISDLNIYNALKWGKILEDPQSSSEIMDYYDEWCTNLTVSVQQGSGCTITSEASSENVLSRRRSNIISWNNPLVLTSRKVRVRGRQ